MAKVKDYTYEEIKAMPDDKKAEVLKELKARFPENKELVEYLNVLPVVSSNLVSKFVEGKQIGRQKMTEEEKQQKREERLRKKQEEAERLLQLQEQQNQLKDEEETLINNETFTIKFSKIIVGEEATIVLGSIGSSLLKDGKYKINLNIEEV